MTASATAYDSLFFNSISGGSARSAERLMPMVLAAVGARSALDVGCGRGVWLAVLGRLGVADLLGVDGAYVNPDTLAIPPSQFRPIDITQRFDLGRRFDLALCLEVGEHIPNPASSTLVANLAAHADMVLFSAAVPGQGGQDHINEQPLSFWRDQFRAQSFVALDPFRPVVRNARDVEAWYRNNMLLYVRENALARLPVDVQATRIPEGAPIADFSSMSFRLRKLALRQLPRPVVTAMARAKHTIRGSARLAG